MQYREHSYGHIMGVKKFAIILIVLSLLVIYLEVHRNEVIFEIGILVGVITFVYGFFINSVFGFIQRKYSDFVQNMSDVSGNIHTLYNLSLLSEQQPFISALRSELTQFIISYKVLSPRDYHKHQDNMDRIFQTLTKFHIKTKKDELIYARILAVMNNLAINRERTEIFGERYLVGENKYLFILLTLLVSSAIILLCIQSWYLMLFGIILVMTIIFLSVLIFNIDRMRYGKLKIRTTNLDDLLKNM